jgi:two-component system response regulator NreC
MPIRILIVDDHGVLRAGLRSLLNNEPGFQVVGEAGTSDDGLRAALDLKPAVVLMDLSIPGMGGLEVTRQLREKLPGTRVVILTVHEDSALLRETMKAGAAGYVVKRAVESELIAAIHAAVRGEIYVHPSMTRGLLDLERSSGHSERRRNSSDSEALTSREIDVVKLLTSGFTNRQIADRLFLSVRTVESHRAHILAKLGLASRADLVRWAAEKKLTS